MTHPSDPLAGDLSKLDAGVPKGLSPDDRRHLTRWLSRHCAAVPFLDACTEGHGPLPKLMDRFIGHTVDTHRLLSGGTFVDAGERLEVHPQSLRVLSRKVESRAVEEGTLLTGAPGGTTQERWVAILAALLVGNGTVTEERLPSLLCNWTGPVDADELEAQLEHLESGGWIHREDGVIRSGDREISELVSRYAQASVIADQVVDHAAVYLATPLLMPSQPRLARLTYSRSLFLRATFPQATEEIIRHLRQTLEAVRRKWGTQSPNGETVAVTLLMGPASPGMTEHLGHERDIWLNALSRHICHQGGLREAMPILYQEVARELRRRSVKRAYDLDLLKAVGRARQNVHEWEAGRGFHFRGPAPETVVDDSPESLTVGHLRQCARVFLQERSQRVCKIGEFITWLQKEVGVKIEEPVLVQILEDEVAMGAAKAVGGGAEPAYQAVRSFRRTWAQNVAQRRANLELVVRATAGLVAGSAAGRPNFSDALALVTVRPGCMASFAADFLERSADFHAQMLGSYDNLDPDHHDVLDVEVSMALSPTALLLGPPLSRK